MFFLSFPQPHSLVGRLVLEREKWNEEGQPPPPFPLSPFLARLTSDSSVGKSNFVKGRKCVGQFWYANPWISDLRPAPSKTSLVGNHSIGQHCVFSSTI